MLSSAKTLVRSPFCHYQAFAPLVDILPILPLFFL
ncbi:MAG: photosystem II reaction center protein K, partial [Cyanobacteria bacterium J06628_4]